MAVLKYKDPVTGEWLPSNSSVIPTLDKEALVQEVIEALGTPVFGRVDEENNIILSGDLVSGNYTLKYENADGSTTNIGTLSVTGEDSGYTNLADPASADWLTNKRINSSKNIVDVTEAQSGGKTCVVTNFIEVAGISKLHIKGLDIINNVNGATNYGRVYTYTDGTVTGVTYTPSAGITSTGKIHYTIADYDSSVVILDLATLLVDFGKTDTTHIRLGGFLTGAADEVIITADEQIV